MAIGLTGGIGSGKSTVAAVFVGLGATLVDTDAIAHALTAAGGAAMPALRQAFGDAIVAADGSLNRQAMRTWAFADTANRRRLEAVLHPLIGAWAQQEAAAARGPLVVFDVPLLAESSHWRQRVGRVLVIDCSEATQLARIVQRPGWTLDSAQRVVTSQAARGRRRSIADAVIHNDGIDLETLASTVRALWQRWLPGDAIAVKQ